MDNPIPGLILEESAGISILFFSGYLALFLCLLHQVKKKGKTPNIFFEGFLACLLADRFLALYSGECFRLTKEWDYYIREWTVCVCLLAVLLVLGGFLLHLRKGKKESVTALLFLGSMILSLLLYNVLTDIIYQMS